MKKIDIKFYGNRFKTNNEVFSYIRGFLSALGLPVEPVSSCVFVDELFVENKSFNSLEDWIINL